MKKFLLLFVTCCVYAGLMAQEIDVRIADYKDDKKCAISYTFDDGMTDHYHFIMPLLDKHGFKGTFWIIGSKVLNEYPADADTENDAYLITWKQLKEMSDRGHEISNHTWTHKNLQKISLDEAKYEIYKTDSVIFEKIGIYPRTFCYPYNASNDEIVSIANENRVGTRLKQHGIGKNTTEEQLVSWTERTINTGDWGVAMIHGIYKGFDALKYPEIITNHLEYVKQREDSVWVATFKEVASYVYERDNITLNINSDGKKIVCNPIVNFDTSLFDQPLTMVVSKEKIRKVTAKQKGKKLPVKIYSDKACIDFMPENGAIEIKVN